MATTTNYGWTTPDDTALVKDGAAAIRTLGSSIDTTTKNLNPETTLGDLAYRSSTANVKTRLALGTANQQLRVNAGATAPEWFTPSGGAGISFITGATFTTSSAVNVNNCFSASYTNYLIMGSITTNSTQVNVGIRMRASGTDNTTADYDRANIASFTTNLTAGLSQNASSWTEVISTYASSTGNNFRIEMFNPFATENTTALTSSTSFSSGDANQIICGLDKPVTTSFDGFSLIANTGTITGYYKVYGLADA